MASRWRYFCCGSICAADNKATGEEQTLYLQKNCMRGESLTSK